MRFHEWDSTFVERRGQSLMDRINFFAVSLCALIGLPSVANADPSPEVQRLMNQPVSLFSFGLVELRIYLEHQFSSGGHFVPSPPLPQTVNYIASAEYDWEKNRIVVEIDRTVEQHGNADLEAECRQVITTLRVFGYVDPTTGKLAPFTSVSFYSGFFVPVGYEMKDLDAGFRHKIDEIIDLHFGVWNTEKKFFSCSAPFLGTGYSVDKN